MRIIKKNGDTGDDSASKTAQYRIDQHNTPRAKGFAARNDVPCLIQILYSGDGVQYLVCMLKWRVINIAKRKTTENNAMALQKKNAHFL